ncbi:MAG: UDP-N-acetylglucosamine 1-carboxyvinyltransferase [Limnochordales bacterium]|nr:UDP-N-acetylglucosamine 1-carboxyvinyltransferase [Limnochordales bacterium]
MARLVIRGGRPLRGEVSISGAKNSALALMVAAALARGETVLHNVPHDRDVMTMADILRELGVKAVFVAPHELHIDGTGLKTDTAPYEAVRQMRASFYVAGLLLARLRRARVPLPGGCQLGSRPVDFHLRGFEALGARVNIEYGYMTAEASRLAGTTIFINRASVGTTINLMLAATLAEGTTVLENAAKEPEIVDLAVLLNSMGARIRGAGTDAIRIDGVDELHPTEHWVIPDRIEAGTYMMAAGITGGDIVLNNVELNHLRTPVGKLMETGLRVEAEAPGRVRAFIDPHVRLRATDVETAPYPGFPTDLQPPFVALLSVADGTSVVRETIFDRFRFVDELRRMGADIRVERDTAIVRGVEKLTGAPVEAMDLRAGAALVLAALAAEGETQISGVELIDRGYEEIEKKLAGVGADIERCEDRDGQGGSNSGIPHQGIWQPTPSG